MNKHHLFILLLLLLASCSSNSGLTSFGNRKYTKGYFWNNPVAKPEVNINTFINASELKEPIKGNNETAVTVKSKIISKTAAPLKLLNCSIHKYTIAATQLKGIDTGRAAKVERVGNERPFTDEPTTDDAELKQERMTTAIMFLIISALSILGLFLAHTIVFLHLVSPITFLVISAACLIFGLVYLWLAQNGTVPAAAADGKPAKIGHLGQLGKVFATICLFISAALVVTIIVVLISQSTIEVPFVFMLLLIAACIAAWIICQIALHNPNEASPMDAKHGADFATIALIAVLLATFIGLLNVPL